MTDETTPKPGDLVAIMVEVVAIRDGLVYFRSDDGTPAYRRVRDIVRGTEGWLPIAMAPKDGSPFFAKVKDWYRREINYHVLEMSINGYWQTAYSGNQTFEDADIIGWQPCESEPPTSK